jgi:hypothetical protein
VAGSNERLGQPQLRREPLQRKYLPLHSGRPGAGTVQWLFLGLPGERGQHSCSELQLGQLLRIWRLLFWLTGSVYRLDSVTFLSNTLAGNTFLQYVFRPY